MEEKTFLTVGAAIGGARGVRRVVGQVAVGLVVVGVGGGRVRVGGTSGGRRRVVVRRQVPHAGALLDDRAVRQPHAEQLQPPTGGSTAASAAAAAT